VDPDRVHLLLGAADQRAPVGIYWLDDERWERYGSELSETYGKLARGEMTATEVTAYRFQPPWRRNLRGYSRFTEHWDWQDPPVARPWARKGSDRRKEAQLPSRLRVAASG
ncbi:MAG TPA: hypothetical protein VHN15_14390, partial [Thermoanaerobaculia bacterium]|nr:hypothetical protein [Thermoanaerobaculia bacterium]